MTEITTEEYLSIGGLTRSKWKYKPIQEYWFEHARIWCNENCTGNWCIKEATWAKNKNRDGSRETANHILLFEKRKDHTNAIKALGNFWVPISPPEDLRFWSSTDEN